MEIEEIREGEVVIVAPHGKLDTQTEAAFERKLKELLDAQARFLVVDFGKVDFVSGGALRALLLTTRRLGTRGGRLILCRVSGVVQQAFTISGFDRVFVMVPTRAEAVEAAIGPAEPPAAAPAPEPEGDDRIARLAALALPLLAAGDESAGGLIAAAPSPLRAGLGDVVCAVLSGASGETRRPEP